MRRRRKKRLSWFPVLGELFTDGDNQEATSYSTFRLQVNGANSQPSGLILPLTFDQGQESLLENQASGLAGAPFMTLADLMSSSWRVRRVVGKLHATFHIRASQTQDPGGSTPPFGVLFGAGLMVREVDESGGTDLLKVSVMDRDDSTDPWIWRRTWILGQGVRFIRNANAGVQGATELPANSVAQTAAASDEAVAWAHFPNTNCDYGGAGLDGPHVDAKTNRLIGPEQRLFLHLEARRLPIQAPPIFDDNSDIIGVFDFRLLGGLERATNRRNASR